MLLVESGPPDDSLFVHMTRGLGIPTHEFECDDEILANATSLSGPCCYTAGTARMGAEERAVVDPQSPVRGVTGLRIADTSILDSGNTNGPAMTAGLRAAQFILGDTACH